MDFPTNFIVILFFSLVWLYIFILSSARARKSSKLPPGPYGPPVIGNILALGSKPHHSLTRLARRYGPVMSLKLGSVTTVVVSSPAAAKIVLQTRDLSLCGRTVPSAAAALNHAEFSMAWLPVESPRWRKLRKLCKEEMFSAARLDAGYAARREKLQKLCDYVRECGETGRAVDVGEVAFTTSLNMISSALFSVDLAPLDSDSSGEMKGVICGVMRCIGSPNLADYFPFLKCVDPQRILKETIVYCDKLFDLFDEIIDERLKSRGEKNDFLEALVDQNQRDEEELSRDEINHLLLDLIVGGTDTTSITVEWAMTELMRSPNKMSRVREEIREFVQENGQEIQESDIPQLRYLQAVVKETLRLHPAGPFLLPHKAVSDVEVNGYIVPQNTQVLVNVWASGRDSDIWTNADTFEPERFLTSVDHDCIDFRGRDFELIPFGAGRRICPGLPMAYRVVHLMLAALVGNFEWKLEGTKRPEEISVDEKFGVTLQKAIPLRAIPSEL